MGCICIICLHTSTSFAQLCEGSLGDPVVNFTFGSGSNPGPEIDADLTNYSFLNYSCPNDGYYTISNFSPDCFNSTWYSVSEDHTAGDVNGYMMIVNASFTPGVFYVDTIEGLCGGTTYEFATWIMNVLKPYACANESRPNLTFNIETTDGTVLKTYQTGDIYTLNAPVWKQYGTFFSTPDNISTVVIRLSNNAPGGCGNDLLLDDLTFKPCGPKITMTLNGLSSLSLDICKGDTTKAVLGFTTEGEFTNPYYQWQTSTDNGINWVNVPAANARNYIRPVSNVPGKYLFRVAAAQASNFAIPSCKIFSDVITITENDIPVVEATNNSPQCIGKPVTLSASQGAKFEWTGPQNYFSSLQQAVISSVSESSQGTYYLKLTTAEGCINIDSTVVTLKNSPTVNAGDDLFICEGSTAILNGEATGYSELNWLASPYLSDVLNKNPIVHPPDSTEYILRASNGVCEVFDTVAVNVFDLPLANAGPDKATIKGTPVLLEGSFRGTLVTYAWSPIMNISSPNKIQPAVTPDISSTYILKVESSNGCGVAVDSVNVTVYQGLFIPNAFSPNADGLNDTWRIETLAAFPKAELKVYNRFGQLVFINKGIHVGWDGFYKGKKADIGAYPYSLDLKKGLSVIKGIVMLVR